MFQDALDTLFDVLESLHIENLIVQRFDCIVNASKEEILEILAKELNNDSLLEYDLQSNLKSVICMIGMFAEKELQRSKEEKGRT